LMCLVENSRSDGAPGTDTATINARGRGDNCIG